MVRTHRIYSDFPLYHNYSDQVVHYIPQTYLQLKICTFRPDYLYHSHINVITISSIFYHQFKST